MSLSGPWGQWAPTGVQVTVLQARGLRIKGKSGTNDAYAVMHVGKEKFQTSVVEKSVSPVWREEAAFDLPSAGGTLHVSVLHRALVGPDKLLGKVSIDLHQLQEDTSRDQTQ
uniref:C2 domain-containing protein n=1 Tax=Knipowitschia caucasica TaxID=637954 RepID=A0AAV2IXZ2_KNICA